MPGVTTLEAEVTNVSAHGFWLLLGLNWTSTSASIRCGGPKPSLSSRPAKADRAKKARWPSRGGKVVSAISPVVHAACAVNLTTRLRPHALRTGCCRRRTVMRAEQQQARQDKRGHDELLLWPVTRGVSTSEIPVTGAGRPA